MKASSSGKETFQRLLTLLLVVLFVLSSARAQTATPLRRPISPEQLMWRHLELRRPAEDRCPDPPDIRPAPVGTGFPLNFVMPIEPGSERRFYRLHILQP